MGGEVGREVGWYVDRSGGREGEREGGSYVGRVGREGVR